MKLSLANENLSGEILTEISFHRNEPVDETQWIKIIIWMTNHKICFPLKSLVHQKNVRTSFCPDRKIYRSCLISVVFKDVEITCISTPVSPRNPFSLKKKHTFRKRFLRHVRSGQNFRSSISSSQFRFNLKLYWLPNMRSTSLDYWPRCIWFNCLVSSTFQYMSGQAFSRSLDRVNTRNSRAGCQ